MPQEYGIHSTFCPSIYTAAAAKQQSYRHKLSCLSTASLQSKCPRIRVNFQEDHEIYRQKYLITDQNLLLCGLLGLCDGWVLYKSLLICCNQRYNKSQDRQAIIKSSFLCATLGCNQGSTVQPIPIQGLISKWDCTICLLSIGRGFYFSLKLNSVGGEKICSLGKLAERCQSCDSKYLWI